MVLCTRVLEEIIPKREVEQAQLCLAIIVYLLLAPEMLKTTYGNPELPGQRFHYVAKSRYKVPCVLLFLLMDVGLASNGIYVKGVVCRSLQHLVLPFA